MERPCQHDAQSRTPKVNVSQVVRALHRCRNASSRPQAMGSHPSLLKSRGILHRLVRRNTGRVICRATVPRLGVGTPRDHIPGLLFTGHNLNIGHAVQMSWSSALYGVSPRPPFRFRFSGERPPSPGPGAQAAGCPAGFPTPRRAVWPSARRVGTGCAAAIGRG